MISTIVVFAAFIIPNTKAISSGALKVQNSTSATLSHLYSVGEADQYKVSAHLHIEQRSGNLLTFMPDDEYLNYDFYTRVLKVESGNATVRYFRPTISVLNDDGTSIDPTPKVVKLNFKADLVMSPINAVLDDTDLTPKKKKKESDNSYTQNLNVRPVLSEPIMRQINLGPLGPFIQQVTQLAVFIGGPGSSLDFCPQLSLYPVKVGDTWKQTVGYQPQNLAEGSGKTQSVVQRLDLTYTYKGTSTYKDKPVLLVTANLALNTDLEKFLEDHYQESVTESHIKSMPLTLNEDMNFYLDPKTCKTIGADLTSSGGFQLMTTMSDAPVLEMKFKGSNVMTLVKHEVKDK